VLSAYDLLQRLHDTGAVAVLRGALGAGDVLVGHVVSLVTAPENALRNLILIGKVLGAINPDVLHASGRGHSAGHGPNPGRKTALAFRLGKAGRPSRLGGRGQHRGGSGARAGKEKLPANRNRASKKKHI
jgi:hypothetical protein